MTSNKVLPNEQRNEMDNNACDHPPFQPQVVALSPPDGGSGAKASRKGRNPRGRRDTIEQSCIVCPIAKEGTCNRRT